MIVDFRDDKNLQVLHRIAKQFVDDFTFSTIKSANIKEEIDALPSDAPLSYFADPINKKFPCHSKNATLISSLYLYGQLANGLSWNSICPQERTEARLEKAAKYWDIYPEFTHIKKAIKKAIEPKSVKEAFAIDVNYRGDAVKKFPVHTEELAVKSAESFRENKAKYPYSWRKSAAINILNALDKFNATVSTEAKQSLIVSSGAYTRPKKAIAKDLLAKSYMYNQEIKQRIQKMAGVVLAKDADLDSRMLKTACDLLDKADRHANFISEYASGMPMPEDILYAASEPVKEASFTFNDNVYTESHIGSSASPFTAMGNDFINEITDAAGRIVFNKLATKASDMPEKSANLFERCLELTGSHKKAKTSLELTEDFMCPGAWNAPNVVIKKRNDMFIETNKS